MEMSDTAKLEQIKWLAKEMTGSTRSPEFYAQAIDSILRGNRLFKLTACAHCQILVDSLEGEICEDCNRMFEAREERLVGRN